MYAMDSNMEFSRDPKLSGLSAAVFGPLVKNVAKVCKKGDIVALNALQGRINVVLDAMMIGRKVTDLWINGESLLPLIDWKKPYLGKLLIMIRNAIAMQDNIRSLKSIQYNISKIKAR